MCPLGKSHRRPTKAVARPISGAQSHDKIPSDSQSVGHLDSSTARRRSDGYRTRRVIAGSTRTPAVDKRRLHRCRYGYRYVYSCRHSYSGGGGSGSGDSPDDDSTPTRPQCSSAAPPAAVSLALICAASRCRYRWQGGSRPAPMVSGRRRNIYEISRFPSAGRVTIGAARSPRCVRFVYVPSCDWYSKCVLLPARSPRCSRGSFSYIRLPFDSVAFFACEHLFPIEQIGPNLNRCKRLRARAGVRVNGQVKGESRSHSSRERTKLNLLHR